VFAVSRRTVELALRADDDLGMPEVQIELRERHLRLVEALVILPAMILLGVLLVRDAPHLSNQDWLDIVIWALLIGAVELLPVPTWRGMTISVGFPILMMVAILYPAGAAGLIALLGSSDPREFRREVSFGAAAYNRCQVAMSVVAASSVFHSIAVLSVEKQSPAWLLISAAVLAAVADYGVNVSLVAVYMSTKLRLSWISVLKQLTIGSARDFLVSYLGLGILGLSLAVLWLNNRWWSIPVYLAPLLFARQVFFRSLALEEAHTELQEREEILRELSNTMAEERADERLQIAGYLHDDLAQVLFRLSLQVDIARKLLEKDDLGELRDQLEKIRESKQETSDRIRALIRDLHRSPLGAKGLSEALESFTDEVGRDSGILFHRDVQEIPLPAPIALLVFHIAREGVMNALKHARATDMWITVAEHGDDFVLELKDNGAGFDTSQPGPEGHFGMAMMRERAKVGGGSFDVESAPGKGTTITVRFPIALLQRGIDSEQASANGTGRASLDTPGTTSREGEDSRDSVPA
jgi:signal transduction histidine kinase